MQSQRPQNHLSGNIKRPVIQTEEVAEQFEEKMRDIRIKEQEKEAQRKSQILNLPYINLAGFPISPETLALIDEATAKRVKAVCFYSGENDIRIGAVDPENEEVNEVLKNLEEQLHSKGKVYIISPHSFQVAFSLYAALPKIRKFRTGVNITEEDLKKFEREIHSFRDLNNTIQKVNITDMVTLIIAAAIKSRASDIHIESEENSIKVRYRIDGILQDVAELKKSVWPKVVARIKLLSKLKINITKKPQDGRFTIFLTNEKIDVRISALPTTYGESIVMRLLMSSAVGLDFEALGLRGKAYEDLMYEILKPNGMIITTGPTGSGKTTTLYSILKKLNKPGTKIITIEDPVEYRIKGINQSQVDHSRGYDFASGLRSILRQDPDIIMVGEIRDLETSDIAINAALTGHLVLSTLHTNDASGTVPRFLAMGVKPFLLAPSLNAMIGQRLVRRLCQYCKREKKLDEMMLKRVNYILSSIKRIKGYDIDEKKLQELKFFTGKGCSKCQHIGYQGRIGIFEIMTMNPEVENLILTGHVSEYDMKKVAVKHGMITMIQDGLLKALEGITSVEEVFRVAKDTTYASEIE